MGLNEFAGYLAVALSAWLTGYLATKYGLQYVGYYLTGAALLTLVGLAATRETRDEKL